MTIRDREEEVTATEKVNLLFDVFVKPNGKRYTNKEVAMNSAVTEATLSSIRTRRYNNPTLSTLQGICDFFDIPLDYFGCKTMDECQMYLARVRSGLPHYEPNDFESNPLLKEIMIKAMGMSDEARRDALKMLEWIEDGDKVRQVRQKAAASVS
ncbi:MAG: helix-turn-helix transcriptional regulator [Anaerolineae bacterium]|nr:helix-turn-helix transcriptional regulator [Anaerolineae bacterium]